jgi:Mut7-C ubiquitin
MNARAGSVAYRYRIFSVLNGRDEQEEIPMSIRVELNPILRKIYRPDYDPDKGLILTNGAGKTLRQIVGEVGIPVDEVSSILVNHRVEPLNYLAQDGDLIHLSIAISGG